MGSGEPRMSGATSVEGYRSQVGGSGSASDEEQRRDSLRWAHVTVNVILLAVLALFVWVAWQEAFSAMPPVGEVEAALAGTPHETALAEAAIDGKDVVLTYDLTGEPYFDEQTRYAAEFEQSARVLLDEFRRIQRVRVNVLQGPEKYEGLSVTDGFGKILEWF